MHIKTRFVIVVTDTLNDFQAIKVDIGRMRVIVANFPVSEKHGNVLFFQQHLHDIRNITSLEELFTILGQYQYWSWNNYGLLAAMVEARGTHEVKQRLKQYQEELRAFYLNTKLSQYAAVVSKEVQSSPPPKPDFVKLIVKLEERWSEYTLKCVEDFWQSFIEEFSLAPYTLRFHEAKPGCISLSFLIPASLAPFLIIESKNKLEFFHNLHILSLTIGDTSVFDRTITNSGLSNEDIQVDQ